MKKNKNANIADTDENEKKFLRGFSPVVDEKCTRIVLGSMPGAASLAAQEYYAHPMNRFWPLMSLIFAGRREPPTDYADKLALLLANRVALWDSVGGCEREGSLDSAIKNERGNDFSALFARYPKIKTVCFNGNKAYESFRRHNGDILRDESFVFFRLPSTSPANARWRFEMLLAAWEKVFS